MSRVKIEESIKKLEQDIFNIEEKSLEPARERLRIAEEIKKNDIERLTVLRQTREEWERQQNTVDIARTTSDEYNNAIQESVNIVDELVDAYENGTTAAPIVTPGTTSKATTKATPKTTPKATPKTTPKATPKPTVKPVVADRVQTPKPTSKMVVADRVPTPKPTAKPTIIESAGKAVAGFVAGLFGYKLAAGGMVPNYLAAGGSPFAVGTDTVPAMLTPGEFVVKRQAVKDFGANNLKAINSGTYSGNSVYNYSLSVNVRSDANPDQIAKTVMSQIRQVDAQRIRSNRL